mgnify:CR=1 FL=1
MKIQRSISLLIGAFLALCLASCSPGLGNVFSGLDSVIIHKWCGRYVVQTPSHLQLWDAKEGEYKPTSITSAESLGLHNFASERSVGYGDSIYCFTDDSLIAINIVTAQRQVVSSMRVDKLLTDEATEDGECVVSIKGVVYLVDLNVIRLTELVACHGYVRAVITDSFVCLADLNRVVVVLRSNPHAILSSLSPSGIKCMDASDGLLIVGCDNRYVVYKLSTSAVEECLKVQLFEENESPIAVRVLSEESFLTYSRMGYRVCRLSAENGMYSYTKLASLYAVTDSPKAVYVSGATIGFVGCVDGVGSEWGIYEWDVSMQLLDLSENGLNSGG